MRILNPTETRLSPHFMLSDFMGCHSVYSKGYRNEFESGDELVDVRLENAKALCEFALEPVLGTAGPISISYGYISLELSERIVRYQDPRKPSHHMWNLGAAADICVHEWVQTLAPGAQDRTGAPLEFALLHMADLPLSRLITYSESPFFCVAVSQQEVLSGLPRKMWYENEYGGVPGAKPHFRKLASDPARELRLHDITQDGFEHGWQGAGFPTYHGGGKRQYQHFRVSAYTMLSDWLFDELFVRVGINNEPQMGNPLTREAFYLAGYAYDLLIKVLGVPRLSIVSAYTNPRSSNKWIEGRDWAGSSIVFELVPPEYLSPEDAQASCLQHPSISEIMNIEVDEDRLIVIVERENAKNSKGFKTSTSAVLASARASSGQRIRRS
ncbi:hypothetical protein FBPa45_0032 [Pseudomonas phage vB_PaeS_FBPa45]|nr:hypothetical protein FBPa45_0032 [Pseudomonas phage vB_PaeS_FBPa45]